MKWCSGFSKCVSFNTCDNLIDFLNFLDAQAQNKFSANHLSVLNRKSVVGRVDGLVFWARLLTIRHGLCQDPKQIVIYQLGRL